MNFSVLLVQCKTILFLKYIRASVTCVHSVPEKDLRGALEEKPLYLHWYLTCHEEIAMANTCLFNVIREYK